MFPKISKSNPFDWNLAINPDSGQINSVNSPEERMVRKGWKSAASSLPGAQPTSDVKHRGHSAVFLHHPKWIIWRMLGVCGACLDSSQYMINECLICLAVKQAGFCPVTGDVEKDTPP